LRPSRRSQQSFCRRSWCASRLHSKPLLAHFIYTSTVNYTQLLIADCVLLSHRLSHITCIPRREHLWTKDQSSIKEICPETNNAGLSSVFIFFVLPTEIQKAESCVDLQRIGYHVMRESVNGVSETALILASLTADNYRAEQLSDKVASIRTVLLTFLILF